MNFKLILPATLTVLRLAFPAAVSAAPICVTSAGSWQNTSFTAQSGNFTAEFDAVPSAARIDGVSGLANAAVSAYSSLAAAVRFNNAGAIDARNGGVYMAGAIIPYTAGVSYHYRLVVNTKAHTYSAYVTPAGGLERLIGANYAFRTEQAAVASLSSLGVLATGGSESACSLAVATAATADITAPALSAVAVSLITRTGATVSWTTNEAADTQVEYGPTTAYGASTPLNATLLTAHGAALSGLTAGTLYHYRVKSKDAAGNLAVSAVAVFTTAAPADTTAPLISAVSSSLISQTGATIAWTTNEASDTQVEYGPTTAYGASTTLNAALATAHSVPLAGLTAGTLYHFRVKSKDAAGNLAVSPGAVFTTATAAPLPGCVTSAGTWKNIPFASQSATFTAEFNATPSIVQMDGLSGLSNGAASAYGALAAAVRFNNAGRIDARNGGAYASAASIPYAAGATYRFRLIVNMLARTYTAYVRPAGGNEIMIGSNYAFRTEQVGTASLGNLAVFASAGSETACSLAVVPAAAGDTTAPLISAVATSGIGANGAAVTWNTNEASDTLVEYGVTTAYGSSTGDGLRTTVHTGNLLALTPSTVYHYRVKSRDAAGNLATSGNFTFTTNAAPTPPPSTATSFSDDFSSYPKNTCFADGSSFGPWLSAFAGYGCTKTATDASGSFVEQSPLASSTPAETHASMILGPQFSGPINYALTMETVAQLRTGSAPNAWEVAWVAWNYTDDTHFYYLALKPNGWELGKEDPAYPGAQRFLASGSSPLFPIGARYGVRIVQDANNTIKIYVGGTLITTFNDTERPYTSGRIAFYNEDAKVRLRSVAVNLPAVGAASAAAK